MEGRKEVKITDLAAGRCYFWRKVFRGTRNPYFLPDENISGNAETRDTTY
jgi:hypothetical protein